MAERYLFARRNGGEDYYEDIGVLMDRKVESLCRQKTVLENFFRQYRLLARAHGLAVDLLEEEIPDEVRVNILMKFVDGDTGRTAGCRYAEGFRRIGAGFLEEFAS